MATQGLNILHQGARCGDLDLSDMTGDVTVSAAGVSAIGGGVIVNADINAAAAIAGSKLNLAGVIVNADINAAAAIVGSKLAANARTRVARTEEIDIDNGAATTRDLVLTRLSKAITITAARVVYTDVTSGVVAAATVQLGVAVAGDTIVAATLLEDAKAVGTITALTLASAAVAANTPLIVRHTGIASAVDGKYYVEIEYTIND